jgi:hypothetical protein
MGGPGRMKLLGLFNNIWNAGKFLTEWTKATVIPILKPGKDPNEPESYRPTYLTNCICKIKERMVNKKLIYILEDRELLPDTQYGFRKVTSTTDMLIGIEGVIAETLRKRKYAALLSLDISKAYDTCWRLRIIRKLKDWKIDGKILKFSHSFMTKRTQQVAIGNIYKEPY